MIEKVISGGQIGADLAGVIMAKKYGIPTGGTMPKGFKNQLGCFPEYASLFNYTEHASAGYKERTWENVQNSDATLRLAFDFSSAGERCTMTGINKFKKPHFDVNLKNSNGLEYDVVDWISSNNIKVLNIAGNSNKTNCYTEIAAAFFLDRMFTLLKGEA